MNRRLLLVPISAFLLITTGSGALADDATTNDGKLVAVRGPNPLIMPAAPLPASDTTIAPPGEQQFFPTRRDGQAYVLNMDATSNLTDALNHFYFNPHFRGEEWSPYPTYWIVEHAAHFMALWPEYDQENVFGIGNKWAKFIERYSGFGPGPPAWPMEK